MRAALLVALSGLLAACGGPVDTPIRVFDAGFGPIEPTDAGPAPDAGPAIDAGTPDAGPPPDGGTPMDSGTPMDGGPSPDGSAPDGGPPEDGGPADAGAPEDGGPAEDAGAPDGGVPEDGGAPEDAGTPDTGVDAGPPIDAGVPDTGAPIDAGAPDTGVDAGVPVDAGAADAGVPNPVPASYTARPVDTAFRHGQTVRMVDLDGDGDRDLLAASSLTDMVRLHLNGGSTGGGNGTNWQAVQVAPLNSIVAMGTAVADFDGDMDDDVVVIGLFDRNQGFTSRGNMTLYRRGAAITDWTAVPVNVGNAFWGATQLAAGDLTGDGLADVVTGSIEWYDPGGNVVGHGLRYHGNTGGNFALPVDIDAALQDVMAIEIVDVDGDGVLDVVAAGRLNGQAVWYENLRAPGQVVAQPSFTRHVIANAFNVGGLTVAQLDADPAPEIALVFDNGAAGAVVGYDPPANPRGLWTALPIGTSVGAGAGLGVYRMAAGDLNADGFTDVVVATDVTDQVRAFVRTATGWTDQRVGLLNGAVGVDIGDLSGDGRDDVAATTYENTPTADRVDWFQTVP